MWEGREEKKDCWRDFFSSKLHNCSRLLIISIEFSQFYLFQWDKPWGQTHALLGHLVYTHKTNFCDLLSLKWFKMIFGTWAMLNGLFQVYLWMNQVLWTFHLFLVSLFDQKLAIVKHFLEMIRLGNGIQNNHLQH